MKSCRINIIFIFLSFFILFTGIGAKSVTAQTADPGYWLGINGKASGPYNLNQLSSMAASGVLTRETLVWYRGMAYWTAAQNVRSLDPLFASVYGDEKGNGKVENTIYNEATGKIEKQTAGGNGNFHISLGLGGIANLRISSATAKSGSPDLSTMSITYGGALFFDFMYAELSGSFTLGTIDSTNDTIKGAPGYAPLEIMSASGSLLLKYPFRLSDKINIFPLAGGEYELYLSAAIDGNDQTFSTPDKTAADAMTALSAIWIRAGVGFDIFFGNSKFFLRPQILYGYRLNNANEEYHLKSTIESYFNHGPQVRVYCGIRF